MSVRLLWLSAGLLVFVLCNRGAAYAAEYPLRSDVESVDGIIRAYYDVISGPAGAKRDLRRDESLHFPDAQIIVLKREPGSDRTVARKLTLRQFHELSAPIFEQGIYETEIHRVQERFGSIIHVWSTYETRAEPQGRPLRRGVNSIQLYHDGSRFWITSWIYDAERPGQQIPARYLPKRPSDTKGAGD